MKLEDFLKEWESDEAGVRDLFCTIYEHLKTNDKNELSFKARPGISYSLRSKHVDQKRDLFVLVDIIDDDPDERWLSICFYADSLSEEQLEEGDTVPGGLAGEDACCFDAEEKDSDFKKLIISCLDTAHAFASKDQ